MRLFIAVDPSAGQRDKLQLLQERLAPCAGGIRWVEPRSLHLTLKFLGEQEEKLIPSIIAAMRGSAASTAPFRLQLGGTGLFPSPQRARIIWSGIMQGAAEIGALAASLEEKLAEAGFPAEKRPFKAHLTLGRVRRHLERETVERLLGAGDSFATEPAAVESMRLYESRLSRQGAQYTLVQEIFFPGK